MQGRTMSSKSQLPPTPAGKPKGYDPLVEPIPLPVVHERDSDTAWAEFDSLMGDESPGTGVPDTDYEDTQPLDLDDAP